MSTDYENNISRRAGKKVSVKFRFFY